MAADLDGARDVHDTRVGLFYGGMARRKNFISMIALSFIALAIVTVQWTFTGTRSRSGQTSAG